MTDHSVSASPHQKLENSIQEYQKRMMSLISPTSADCSEEKRFLFKADESKKQKQIKRSTSKNQKSSIFSRQGQELSLISFSQISDSLGQTPISNNQFYSKRESQLGSDGNIKRQISLVNGKKNSQHLQFSSNDMQNAFPINFDYQDERDHLGNFSFQKQDSIKVMADSISKSNCQLMRNNTFQKKRENALLAGEDLQEKKTLFKKNIESSGSNGINRTEDDKQTLPLENSTKLLNLAELKTINELYSLPQTEGRSLQDSFTTKHSQTEQRKRVSDYLLSETEPLFQNSWSKSYIGSKNQSLVLLKTLERRKIDVHTQEKMRIEFRQIMIREADMKNDEYHYAGEGNETFLRTTVSILDYFQTKAYLYIVYEYLHQQSLLSHLLKQQKQKMTDFKAVALIQKIVEALESFVAEQMQQHNNLKLENIFYDQSSQVLRLSDFCKSYALAKSDIINSESVVNSASFNFKQNTSNSDVKQIGIIYLQLLCGLCSSAHTKDFYTLQKFLNVESLNSQVTEFILKCLFVEETSLTDIKIFLSNYQNKLQKQNPLMYTPQNQKKQKSTNNSAFKQNESQPKKMAHLLFGNQSFQESQTKFNDEKSSFIENQQQEHQAGKVKEITFLKKYSYAQSENSFELKIIHLKMTKYYIKEELITNEQEFETTHSIPIFRNKCDEGARRKSQMNQINYNPKYQWNFLSELDNQSYFETDEGSRNSHLVEGYYRMFSYRSSIMRCFDFVSKKNYVVKCISVEDDEEFLDSLKEIALHKYMDYNIQIGLKIDQDKEENTHFNRSQFQVIQVYHLISSLSLTFKDESLLLGGREGKASAQTITENYLNKLYQHADKEVKKQLEGGIHKFLDSYIVHRAGHEFSFVLVFEDAQFTLKDFLLRNKSKLQDCSEHEDIQSAQILQLVKVMAKQIKNLKRIGLFHNSITPENILFQTCKSGKKRILLCNFESAIIMKPNQLKSDLFASFQKLPSPFYKYRAPEIREVMEVTLCEKESILVDPVKSDIFSLGICTLELKLKEFCSDSQMKQAIKQMEPISVEGNLLLYMTHPSSQIRFQEKEILSYIKTEIKKKSQIYQMMCSSEISKPPNIYLLQASDSLKLNIPRTLEVNTFNELPRSNVFNQNEIKVPNIFTFQEKILHTIGEIEGDLQLLYQSQCARKLYLFYSAHQALEILECKYIKGKQKLPDQVRLEFLLMDELGNHKKDLYDREKCLQYYTHALSIQQKYLPHEIFMSGQIQLKLAILILDSDQKNNNQLMIYLKNSLQCLKETLGNSSPKLVKILSLLGDECALKGQIQEALHYFQECMIITNALGYSGPLGIRILEKLGWAFFQTSDFQSAQKFFQRSAQIKEKVLIFKDMSLAETYNNLAECNRVLNDQAKAVYYYEQALSVAYELQMQKEEEENLQEFRAQVFNNLGIMYKQMGKLEKSKKLFKEANSIRSEIFGPSSFQALESIYNLAQIYDDQKFHTQAMQLYDQIIQQFKLIKDLDNLMYAECLQSKGLSYYFINDFKRAQALLNESLQIKKKKCNNSITLAITLQNLALVYHKEGSYKKALQYYEEAYKIFLKKLKPDHPYISTIEENMKQTQKFQI